jgi:hypothetical protein
VRAGIAVASAIMLVVLLAVPGRAQFETSKAVERGGEAVRQIAGRGPGGDRCGATGPDSLDF